MLLVMICIYGIYIYIYVDVNDSSLVVIFFVSGLGSLDLGYPGDDPHLTHAFSTRFQPVKITLIVWHAVYVGGLGLQRRHRSVGPGA